MDIKKFWNAVLRQDANAIRSCFHSLGDRSAVCGTGKRLGNRQKTAAAP